MRLDAHYYGFDSTTNDSIDLILSAVACAGKAYHHTDYWTDEAEPNRYNERLRGSSMAEAIQNAANDAAAEIARLTAERDGYKARKDAAYLERNQVVAALAKCFPSGVARTAIEGWSEDWHGCVYIDLPTGQVSWHFHDSHAHLFADLPSYQGAWDGHDTPEKYRRLASLEARDLTAERDEARALAVWAVLHSACIGLPGEGLEYWETEEPPVIKTVECDGTDAGILDALRRAQEASR